MKMKSDPGFISIFTPMINDPGKVKDVAWKLLNTNMASYADVGEFVFKERSGAAKMKIARRAANKETLKHTEAVRIIQFYQRLADQVYLILDTAI